MSSVGLLFVGAVLFLDALVFLGKIEPKDAAPFNLFVGALQTAVPFYLIATATSPGDVLQASGIFMFGFTYLYVGIVYLTGRQLVGFGWYSAWVSVMAAAFGVTEIVKFHDTKTALLWFQWSVLWGMFFVVIALGVTRLTTLAGWTTMVMAFTTCTIPGFVLLLGEWNNVPSWAGAILVAATALGLLPLARSALRPVAAPVSPTHDRVPVLSA